MASTRLPGKVMLPLGNKNVIQVIIERLKKSSLISEICVATTTNDEDNVLVDFLKSIGTSVFRGSEENVLERVLQAAQSHSAQIIVEITGDCPFVDPNEIDRMIEQLMLNDLEYVANNFQTTYADGFDIQVYYTYILEELSKLALTQVEKEHVTMRIRQNPQLYKTRNLTAPPRLHRPQYSVTLDTNEDYEVIKKVYENMEIKHGSNYGIFEITQFLDENPEVTALNDFIARKGYS